MEVAITKMNSKGQVIISSEMRKDVKEGEKRIVIKKNGRYLLKKATDMDKQLLEDLEFANRTEEAWKEYDRAEFISQDGDEFLKDLEKWSKK
jgi:bifunctional DNA-binding transcriptional regulator/antitoxin component of YhaV-PrlF toxin-antitoxin module